MKTEEEVIRIPTIRLQWSGWFHWAELKIDARSGGVRIPNGEPGVYEARHEAENDRLTIGRTTDLRFRIRQGLVKGKTGHSAGESIRDEEDTSTIVVRWARTDRPATVEEELHRRHVEKFGRLPRYVQHT